MINLELHYTESYILEVAVHKELWEAAPNRAPDIGTSRIRFQPLLTASRVAMMWYLLDSNKAFVQKFLEVHDSSVQFSPCTVFWRMCYVLASLIRLTFTLVESSIVSDRTATAHILSVRGMPDESRSRQAAQQIADEIHLTQIIDDLAAKFERVAQAPVAGVIRTNDNLTPFITKLKKLAIAYSKRLRDAISGANAAAVETDLMGDCQSHAIIQDSHRGPTEQPNRDAPGDDTQVGPFEGVEDGGGEGNFQTQEWPLLGDLTGLESVDMDWESIMQSFSIPP